MYASAAVQLSDSVGSGFKLSRMLEVKVLGADATFDLLKLFMLLFYASYSTYFSVFTPVDL